MEILTAKSLGFQYALGKSEAISDISFSLSEGEFAVLCGPTGCGKSTLLRMLKRELTPMGEKRGTLMLFGKNIDELDDVTAASAVGFVMQRPEQQIVTDKVWHELAFGLENLAVPQDVIRRRVAEMASYFGIEEWFEKDVSDLSGGQKQLLNLAAIMVMQPKLLILDEPTSQLDPIAASEFLDTVKKLNSDMGLTVIIVEHRLQEVVPMASRIMVMEKGRLTHNGKPREVCEELRQKPHILEAMPSTVRLYSEFEKGGECPLTIQEGRTWISGNFNIAKLQDQSKSAEEKAYSLPNADSKTGPADRDLSDKKAPALELDTVWFRYERNGHDILRGTTLTVYQGEILCILGGNGSGKTTCISAAAGILKPYSGRIRIFGKDIKEYKNQSLYRNCLTMLPQDVQTVFLKNTVREELEDAMQDAKALPYDIESLLDKHPYDLSGGEQQLVALAKVLATKPRLLLLDEPTKGLDAHAANGIIKILKDLKASGITLVIVTHDVEFAANAADRCAMFFRGEATSVSDPKSFFSENSFYTTAVNRLTRGILDGCITFDDAKHALEHYDA